MKGVELLRQQYEKLSSKPSQSRTPLHPVQQKSATKSIPTSSSNITILNRTNHYCSQQPTAHRPDRQGDGVLSSIGGRERTLSEQQDCDNESNNDRKLTMNCEDATASTSSHSKEHVHGQNSKQSIEQLPQPSPTCNNIITTGSSITAASVTMTTEVMDMDSTDKEGSTEVTPERSVLSCGSTTKRRLKLEEGASCRPQTKRRRTSTRGSSGVHGGGGKKSVAKLGSSLQEEGMKKSVQTTMQSFFKPV